jgi:hypothetical protein
MGTLIHLIKSSSAMLDALELAHSWSDVILSDGFNGTWKPHHFLTEIAEQLGISTDLDASLDIPLMPNNLEGRKFLPFSSFIARGIDNESDGDFVALRLESLAKRIANSVGTSKKIAILLPGPSGFMASEDVFFIKKLNEALSLYGGTVRLFGNHRGYETVFDDTEYLPCAENPVENVGYQSIVGCPDFLIPGVVAHSQISQKTVDACCLVRLSKDTFFIPYELRQSLDREELMFFYDELAADQELPEWLQAFANANGHRAFCDRQLIMRFAWKAISLGACDLGIHHLEYLHSSASDRVEKAATASQMQGLNIARSRFDRAAAATIIGVRVPESLHIFQLLAKGWGLVMVGDLPTADSCFAQIRTMLGENPVRDNEYLYFLNICALLDFKSGRLNDALAKENEIESALSSTESDFKLYFVNKINLARIHNRLDNLALSFAYYAKAFKTVEGIKKESDLIYHNFVLGKVLFQAGEGQQAFKLFLRSALHWLACNAPEFVSHRLKTNTGYRTPRDGSFTAYFSRELTRFLRLTSPRATEPDCRSCVHFQSLQRCTDPACCSFIGNSTATIGVLSPESNGGEEWPSEESETTELGKLVMSYLQRDLGLVSQPILNIYVDNHSGNEMPNDVDQLMDFLLSNSVGSISWEGKLVVTEEELACDSNRITVHPAVKFLKSVGLDSYEVEFKRYLEKAVIHQYEEIRVLRQVYEGRPNSTVQDLSQELKIPGPVLVKFIIKHFYHRKLLRFTR